MRFAQPQMFWVLLALLPALIIFLVWSWRKKQKLIRQFVRSRLLADLTVGVSKSVQKVRLALLVLAVIIILLALARPQWGFSWEESRQRGLDILVAIDTSQSMLAEDIAPNRLARAKLAALDLMQLARHDRLGLIAFAGSAFLQCPLTLDDEIFRQSVTMLDTKIIPQGGTAIEEAIAVATATVKKEENSAKALVILTDGEDQGSGVLDAAADAAKAGLHVFTIGVGTAAGEILRRKDERGVLDYIKDEQGNIVKSRLNESLLRQIAAKCNGFYLPFEGNRTMELLYERGLASLPKTEITARLLRQYHERFQWPLGLAIALLLVEMFVPERRRVSRAEAARSATVPAWSKAVAAFFLLFFPAALGASPSAAERAYGAGNYAEAQREYETLAQRRPNDSRLYYNAGTAAYRNGQYERATNSFQAALQATDLNLQERSYYNLGNTLYQLGEASPAPDQKIGHWEQALQNFQSALKLNAQDLDAKQNVEFLRKKLEELKKQQPKKEDPQSSSKQNDSENNPSQKQKPDANKDQKSSDKQDQQDQGDNQKPAQDEPQPQSEDPQQQQGTSQTPNQGSPQQEQEGRNETGGNAGATPLGQMSVQDALKLLEAQKGEEKPLIFLPPGKKQKGRVFRDW